MARVDYWQYLLDRQGNPLQYAEVRVYLAGTTDEANIYLDSKFGSISRSSTEDLKTNQYGFVQFWVGDQWETEGGYNTNTQFKIVWQNDVDGIEETIDNIYIFTPVRPINITDSIKGVPSNKDKDKVISNTQGYDWDTHVDLTLPSGSPHGIAPAEFFQLGTLQSKTISNKLGYQMYQMAALAATTPVNVSGAKIYSTTASWTPCGSVYFDEVTHNLDNIYPVIELIKDNNTTFVPLSAVSLNKDQIKVWVDDNISARIVVIG